MNLDRILQIIEVGLLIWITAQGEAIRFYEKGVYQLHSEREKERRDWREQKRKQQVKKSEAQWTNTESTNGNAPGQIVNTSSSDTVKPV